MNWRQPSRLLQSWLKGLLFALALAPLARLIGLGLAGGLGVNPIETVTRSTGEWTLIFLCLTLSITPLRVWLSLPWLLRLRRMLGLYAFFYGLLHLTTYLWFDQFFDWAAIGKDILKRPFITVGMGALLLMAPLALTSHAWAIRRLGAPRWLWLHRLIYLIAPLGVLHWWWLVKADISQPLLYAALLTGLLGWRVWRARRGV